MRFFFCFSSFSSAGKLKILNDMWVVEVLTYGILFWFCFCPFWRPLTFIIIWFTCSFHGAVPQNSIQFIKKFHTSTGTPWVLGTFYTLVFMFQIFVFCSALLPVPVNSKLLQSSSNLFKYSFISHCPLQLLLDIFVWPYAYQSSDFINSPVFSSFICYCRNKSRWFGSIYCWHWITCIVWGRGETQIFVTCIGWLGGKRTERMRMKDAVSLEEEGAEVTLKSSYWLLICQHFC